MHADDRSEGDPFVIAGGPCAYNPEPYAPFFDAFCVGEGSSILVIGIPGLNSLIFAGVAYWGAMTIYKSVKKVDVVKFKETDQIL